MYKYVHDILPQGYRNKFVIANQIHSYCTRESSMYRLPFCRTEHYRHSLQYRGPFLWNSLPSDIKSAPTLYSFKKALKSHFINSL